MRLTLAAIMIASMFPAVLCAQGTVSRSQEPASTYQAIILDDDVFVRSGPSHNHYPTAKLRPGDHVTVHRHEPGGWLMISPPQGSFDWISADNVEMVQRPQGNQPGRGTVRVNRAVVRIGSSIEENSRDFYHVTLTRGKRVSILSEKVFDTPQGPQTWYKIEPPADDHRWILGQFVQRIEKGGPRPDPFETDNNGGDLTPPDVDKQRQLKRAQRMLAEQQNGGDYDDIEPGGGGLKERKMVRIDNPATESAGADAGGARTGPTQAELEDDRTRMARLDGIFNEIVSRKTSQWDFQRLEQDYQNLQRSAADNAVRRHVDLRLRKVAQYKKIKAEHDEFVRLTRESDEREARILSLRSQPAPTTVTREPQQQQQRFSGAGIVHRSIGAPRGAPVHALVAPDGRVLAYLQGAQGVNLDRYLGRAVGINGPRTHQPQWNTDHILVEKLTPVNLKQP